MRNVIAALAVALALPVAGQSATVYRCPGPPVIYVDDMKPDEARERNCRAIEGAPITVEARNPVYFPVTAEDLRKCIAYWQGHIDQQKRIGRVSGVVDKHVLYVAGMQLVDCQDRLAALKR